MRNTGSSAEDIFWFSAALVYDTDIFFQVSSSYLLEFVSDAI